MKKFLSGIILFTSCVIISGMSGCKSNETMIKCPELSSASKHHPVFMAKATAPKAAKQTTVQAETVKPAPKGLMASIDKGIPVNLMLPTGALMGSDGKDNLDDVNQLLNQYSNNKVSIQKKENGKTYLQAKSMKDLFALTSSLSKTMIHPRGYYERRYGTDRDRIAVAGGVIGLIAFIFSFIPILDFLAIPMGIVGIILGAIGVRSHRRHIAIMGIVFGFLALLIAPLLGLIYYFAPHPMIF